jgi:hypothetical protein
MGLAPAIALGLALARPDRRAVVFDGDGNLLMNLGILAMIGGRRTRNLLHLVFDNEVYGSTGNQASPSREVRLDRLAAGAGYRTAVAVAEPGELETALRWGRRPALRADQGDARGGRGPPYSLLPDGAARPVQGRRQRRRLTDRDESPGRAHRLTHRGVADPVWRWWYSPEVFCDRSASVS